MVSSADFRLDHQRDMRAGRQLRQGRRRAMHQIADAADIEDDVILARSKSTMPVSFPIMRAPPSMRARVSGKMRMGDGAGERIGGVGLLRRRRRAAGAAPSPEPAPCCAWPAPTTHFLMWLGEYSAISSPACAPASSATARAWPSLSAADGSFATKACSTAIADGLLFGDHCAAPRCNAISRNPSPSAARLVRSRHARHGSACEPETSITPQPMRARPGSRPRMRIGALIGLLYPLCSTLS